MQDYERIEHAIAYLDEHFRSQPSIADVAAHVGLSESHFHRLFREWAGITPKRFLEFVTAEHARKLLEDSNSVLDSTYDSGLSSPGRLHDLFVTLEGVTPGEVRARGGGLELRYGFHASPFGECLLAETDRGVTTLGFASRDQREPVIEELRQRWPRARLVCAQRQTARTFGRILAGLQGTPDGGLKLFVQGTNFQVRVWEALLKIPNGLVVSYERVAEWIGRPSSSRAVGNAVGANPIALLIPCHRVLRKTGAFGNYGGGRLRKRAILAWEAAHSPAVPA
jgi:AraC family transcriptional regulator of adaptative response/methylated-DNA-[protein]-cysteine methyltransferase